MIVPEHISVTGEALRNPAFEHDQQHPQRERLMRMMNVPDRIVLRGGDSYEGFEAEPLELMDDRASRVKENDLQDLPNTITLAENPYLDREEANISFTAIIGMAAALLLALLRSSWSVHRRDLENDLSDSNEPGQGIKVGGHQAVMRQ
ncbi:unnamed protein product [Heligmosomoides polygyrus]|uniref:Mitochondrial fission factor n=1 Tax=Heligmosomoides polygyrus TaxID=6339 RepID=A0A183G407_HELPZ|nr:unnamed protein product [Heligmosomoides polygyrus]